MKEIETASLDRRGFLRGAAGLVVIAALGVEAQSQGDAAILTQKTHTTLALWSHNRFINPAALMSSALAGPVAQVAIHGYSAPAQTTRVLQMVKAYFAIQSGGHLVHTPVYAWAAHSQCASKDVRLQVPIAHGGLQLSAELSGSAPAEDFYFLTSGRALGKPKLHAGTYALIAGSPDLTGICLSSSKLQTRSGEPAGFEYLLVSVA